MPTRICKSLHAHIHPGRSAVCGFGEGQGRERRQSEWWALPSHSKSRRVLPTTNNQVMPDAIRLRPKHFLMCTACIGLKNAKRSSLETAAILLDSTHLVMYVWNVFNALGPWCPINAQLATVSHRPVQTHLPPCVRSWSFGRGRLKVCVQNAAVKIQARRPKPPYPMLFEKRDRVHESKLF